MKRMVSADLPTDVLPITVSVRSLISGIFIQTADLAFEFQVRNTVDKLNLNLVAKKRFISAC